MINDYLKCNNKLTTIKVVYVTLSLTVVEGTAHPVHPAVGATHQDRVHTET